MSHAEKKPKFLGDVLVSGLSVEKGGPSPIIFSLATCAHYDVLLTDLDYSDGIIGGYDTDIVISEVLLLW